MRLFRNQMVILLLPVALLISGCQSMNLASPAKLFVEEPEFVTPTKIIPVWSDTVLHQAGRKGQRGCGGRVMFYAGDGKRAVQVDGSLVVYVWDDSRDNKQRKPDRKYAFSAGDFQSHFSESSIGESYSFWIPWDETGGQQTVLTLVARFVGRNGAEITSSPAKVILPGEIAEPVRKTELGFTRSEESETQNVADKSDGIQQVSFERSIESPSMDRRRKQSITATEIPLTDGFLNRNMSNRAAPYSAEELLKEPGDIATEADSSLPTRVSHQRSRFSEASETNVAAGSGDEPSVTISPPEDRSLRFQQRVQNSRAAQRSVDHALSQRYQTKSRRAPWEDD